jgi:hypothetical protein
MTILWPLVLPALLSRYRYRHRCWQRLARSAEAGPAAS